MFQAGDEDPWAEFNLRYCKVVLCLTSSQSIGIPRFVEDSQTDNLFNLGLSVSQEIPLCVSMDYDEAGEAHFLPRSNSMVLFPGLPVLREKVAAAPASLLCTSSELSSDLEGKNEREEKETTSLLKHTTDDSPVQTKKAKVSPPPPTVPPVTTIPRPVLTSPPPPTTRVTRSTTRAAATPSSPMTSPTPMTPPGGPYSSPLPHTPTSPVPYAPVGTIAALPSTEDGRLMALSKRQAHLMGYPSGLPEEVLAHIQRAEEHIKQIYDAQEQTVDQLKKMQHDELQLRASLLTQPQGLEQSSERCNKLLEEQEKLLRQQSLELQRLSEIIKTLVLDSSTLHTVRSLIISVQLQAQQLAILREELIEEIKFNGPLEAHPGALDPLGLRNWRLVILEQPLPHVMFKSKLIDVSFHLGLVTGARCVDLPRSLGRDVHCILDVPEGIQEEQANVQPLDNFVTTLDLHQKQAIFNQLKVLMTMVSLKFSMRLPVDVQENISKTNKLQTRGRSKAKGRKSLNEDNEEQGATTEGLLVSPMSYPFIVITHENQWVEAASKLLIVDCFSGVSEVPWPQFANTLHSHFLSSIKQDLSSPTRALQLYELQYFHTKLLGNKDAVALATAQTFFSWFGHVQRTIRFKKHISNLWNDGLIFGFMAKETCEQLLSSMEPGVFIIRFSDSRPGLFAVAYVSTTQLPKSTNYEVKHYLVNNQDTGSNKSLPDFLRSLGILSHILKIDPLSGATTKSPKDTALGKYYTKQKATPPLKGYVNNIATL